MGPWGWIYCGFRECSEGIFCRRRTYLCFPSITTSVSILAPNSQCGRHGECAWGKGRDLAGFSAADFDVSFKDGGVPVYEGQSSDGHDLWDCTEIEDGLISEDREVY